jgi:hypothetical protein
MQARAAEAVGCGLLPLVQRYIPDWSERLLADVKEKLWFENRTLSRAITELKNGGLLEEWQTAAAPRLTRAERLTLSLA